MSRFLAATLFPLFACTAAWAGVTLGLGLEYTPIIKLQYVNNPVLNTEIVDNIAWQGRAFYDFGNGFRAGSIIDYYSKSSNEDGFRSIKLSQWGVGLVGDYAYDITEAGNTFIVGGMETGYGELSDRSASPAVTAGSIWVGGLAGVRFHITYNIWCELDYRLAYLEYELNSPLDRKYLFSGSSLRLALEYPLTGARSGSVKKGDDHE